MAILIVDNDGKSLAPIQQQARKKGEVVHIALSAALALQRMAEEGPYALVLAEYALADTDGLSFLHQVRIRWPDTVRVLMSRSPLENATLIQAVNTSKIYSILPNPCSAAELASMLEEALVRYDRNVALNAAFRQQHAVFAKVLHDIVCWLRADVCEMISPVLPLFRALYARLGNGDSILPETALLSSVMGMICMPHDTLDKVVQGLALSTEDRLHFANHPLQVVELFRHVSALRNVANLLREYAALLQQCSGTDTTAFSCTQKTEKASPGALILALIMEYRLALYQRLNLDEIVRLLSASSVQYPSEYVQALREEVLHLERVPEELPLDALKPQMVVARAITGERDGAEIVLVPEGYELSRTTIVFLRQTARHGRVHEPIAVFRSARK
ncbi:hypothetical protein MASR1M90_12350 [Desulfovibrionales bacterium]